jgi:membrane fusion protein, heavy metal efflux system
VYNFFRCGDHGTFANSKGHRLFALRLLMLLLNISGPRSAFAADEIKVSTDQIKTIGIVTEPISERPAVPKLLFPARVVIPPNQIRMISAPLAGRLDTIDAGVDMPVKQGQVLARLSGPAWTRAQFEFVQAVKQEKFLRSTLDREQSLSSDRIVSPKQILATQNDYAQAQTSVSEKRNALKMSGMSDAEVERLAVKTELATSLPIAAPIDGVILEVSAISGQAAEAMTPLFKLAALSPLWLEIQVPVAQIARLHEQDLVTVPPGLGAGKIVSIGNGVDPANQSVIARAEITTSDRKLRPQQVVEAEITLASTSGEKFWGVNPAAVIRHEGKSFVFVRIDQGFRPQEVVVQAEAPELTVISGPFAGAESVAVKGLVPLKGAWQGLGGGGE